MRIEYIKIKNFRQHHNIFLEFHKKKETGTDLHILIANNGTGKTNIMNAISWCMYEKFLNDSKEKQATQKLPLYNLHAFQQAKENGQQDFPIMVEIKINKNEDNYIIQRTCNIRISINKEMPSKLKVTHIKPDGESEIYENSQLEEANEIIRSLIPFNIQQYSFFNGEQLQYYFNENDAPHIKEAIATMAQIDVLRRVEKHLNSMETNLKKDISKYSPDVAIWQKKLDDAKKKEVEYQEILKQLQEQATLAKQRINEYQQKISGNEHIAGKDRELTDLSRKLDQLMKQQIEQNKEYWKFLMRYYTLLATKKETKQFKEYVQHKEITETSNNMVDAIRKSLDNHCCELCHTEITNEIEMYFQSILNQYQKPNIGYEKIRRLKDPIEEVCQEASQYAKKYKSFYEKDESLQEEINDLNKQITEVEKILSKVASVEDVKNWVDEKQKFEKQLEKNQQKKGMYTERQNNIKTEIENFQKELDKAIDNSKIEASLKEKLCAVTDAKQIIISVQKDIVQDTRETVEKETKKYFFQMDYKKNTFNDIKVNDDYRISIFNQYSQPMLNSLSAGEQKLLALSFTLALIKASGYGSMLFIDTPVSNIDEENRRLVAKGLREVSKDKQIVLFFTPSEYDAAIQEELQGFLSSKRRMKLSEDESHTIIMEEG